MIAKKLKPPRYAMQANYSFEYFYSWKNVYNVNFNKIHLPLCEKQSLSLYRKRFDLYKP